MIRKRKGSAQSPLATCIVSSSDSSARTFASRLRLRGVRANHLERVEIGAAHVARHVLAREARGVETFDVGLLVLHGRTRSSRSW